MFSWRKCESGSIQWGRMEPMKSRWHLPILIPIHRKQQKQNPFGQWPNLIYCSFPPFRT